MVMILAVNQQLRLTPMFVDFIDPRTYGRLKQYEFSALQEEDYLVVKPKHVHKAAALIPTCDHRTELFPCCGAASHFRIRHKSQIIFNLWNNRRRWKILASAKTADDTMMNVADLPAHSVVIMQLVLFSMCCSVADLHRRLEVAAQHQMFWEQWRGESGSVWDLLWCGRGEEQCTWLQRVPHLFCQEWL